MVPNKSKVLALGFYIDLEKVYDRVPREILWKDLEKKGVRVVYIRVISRICMRGSRLMQGYQEETPNIFL